jgi:transcriptional regulator with XRE-family HTH domain
MAIGDTLKAIREAKGMSQGDIEKRTGLIRCYISRVENGHTVPAIETLEKFARALEVQMYELFYDDEKPPTGKKVASSDDHSRGSRGREARAMSHFRKLLAKTSAEDRKLLLNIAEKMIAKKPSGRRSAA